MIARVGVLTAYKRDLNEMSPPAHELSAPEIVPNIELPEGVKVSHTALVFPPDFAIDDWAALGAKLAAFGQGIQWWIGDWWHYGFHEYGERKAKLKAREAFGYSFGTLMNWGSVAGKVEASRRREALSFSHHVEVAPLPAEEQEKWLNDAERGKLSIKQLRRKMDEAEDRRSDFERKEDRASRYSTVLGWLADKWRRLGSIDLELLSLLHAGELRELSVKFDEASDFFATGRDNFANLLLTGRRKGEGVRCRVRE